MKTFIHKIRNISDAEKFYFCFMLLILTVGFMLISSSHQPDMFFIIRTGKDILAKGFVPTTNDYVMNGNNFVVHQWLYDVIVVSIIDMFKHQQLALHISFIFQIAVFLWITFKYRALYSKRSIFDILIVLLFIFNEYCMSVRPELVTLIILMLEIYCLSKYRLTQKVMYLYYLPIASILMANLHTMMWPAIYAVLLAYLVPSICSKIYVSDNIKINKHVFFSIILSLGCLCINPYTYKIFSFTITALNISGFFSTYITELVPLLQYITCCLNESFATRFYVMFCVIVLILFLVYFLSNALGHHIRNEEGSVYKVRSSTVYMTLGFLLMTFMHNRNVMFTILALIMCITECSVAFGCHTCIDSYKNFTMTSAYKRAYCILIVVICFLFCGDIALGIDMANCDDYADYLDVNYREGIDVLLNDPDYDNDVPKYVTFNYASFCEYMGMNNLFADVRMEYSDFGEHNMHTFATACVCLDDELDVDKDPLFTYDKSNSATFGGQSDMQFERVSDFLEYYKFEYVILDTLVDNDFIQYLYTNENDNYELYFFNVEDFLNGVENDSCDEYAVIFKRIH